MFITSDNHFSHSQIIKGTSSWPDTSKCRDFETVEEHDTTILNNINEVVEPNDTLYILGDFSVGSNSGANPLKKKDAYIHYRGRINCNHIIYVRGNHSLEKNELRSLNIFEGVHSYYELRYKKQLICMFHYPILSWNSMQHGSLMLNGHSHSNDEIGRRKDIGVDSNNFKPYNLDDLIERLSKNPIVHEGHH